MDTTTETQPQHAVFLNAHNLAVASHASTDPIRLNLAGVYLTPYATVATDGHALAIVTMPKVSATDFPEVAHVNLAPAKALTPCILPTDACKALARALPKGKRTRDILKNACVDVDASNANGHVRIVTTDLETSTPIEARKIEAEFPDYARVLPSGEPTLTIGFNAELLARALHLAGRFNQRSHAVKLEFFAEADGKYAECQPVKITSHDVDTGQTCTVVVMPMRL